MLFHYKVRLSVHFRDASLNKWLKVYLTVFFFLFEHLYNIYVSNFILHLSELPSTFKMATMFSPVGKQYLFCLLP